MTTSDKLRYYISGVSTATLLGVALLAGLAVASPAEGLNQYYEGLKKSPQLSSGEKEKLYRETVGKQVHDADQAARAQDARKLQEARKRWTFEAKKRSGAVRDRVGQKLKEKGKGPLPLTSSTPSPVAPAKPALRVQSSGISEASSPGFSGPIEGGGVTEVIDFPGAPSVRPAPSPSMSLRERTRLEAIEKVRKRSKP